MQKRFSRVAIGAVAVAALAIPFAGMASAADHLVPGTPGDKNCAGQTTAYLAQGNDGGAPGINGIGNVADFAGLTVKQVKAIVDTYCG